MRKTTPTKTVQHCYDLWRASKPHESPEMLRQRVLGELFHFYEAEVDRETHRALKRAAGLQRASSIADLKKRSKVLSSGEQHTLYLGREPILSWSEPRKTEDTERPCHLIFSMTFRRIV